MKTALAFSGGKDSWACLWLNKDRLKEITVLWINTGKNYPEMLNTINFAKSICENFIEILVDRVGQNDYHGIPSDIVPIDWTLLGQSVTGKKSIMVQSYIQCCHENIGFSLMKYCQKFGFTHLIRGQRNDEGHKSSARNGDVIEGITYVQPVENWTAKQVLDFVGEHMEIPNHFRFKHSSMDCYDCTAYRKDSADRIEYMEKEHPALFAEYSVRANALNSALREAQESLLHLVKNLE